MVAILLQIIAVCINIIVFLSTIRKLKYKLRIIYVVMLIFQVIFVAPIILEWLFGIQDYSYKSPGFDKALNDTATNLYYSLFVIIIPIGLYLYGRQNKENKGIVLSDIKDSLSNLKINRELYVFIVILMFLPGILALLSPSPETYIMEYAYFQKHSDIATESELWYHNNILRIGGFISLLAIVITKFFSKNSFSNNLVIYTAAVITGILNGKRTLFAFIVLGILIVDILKSPKGKFPYKKVMTASVSIVVIFIVYTFIVDKHTLNVNTLDNLRLYFFRDIDVKYSIYALLNPAEYKVLEYWGQSYLYNILFYVPRMWWINKPYPYDIYVTASALNQPPGTVLSWSFQTSFFGEAISNLGWFGILFSLVIINKFIKISERSKNPIVILLCIFITVFSFMNHFGAYSQYLIIWVLLVIYNKFKKKNILSH